MEKINIENVANFLVIIGSASLIAFKLYPRLEFFVIEVTRNFLNKSFTYILNLPYNIFVFCRYYMPYYIKYFINFIKCFYQYYFKNGKNCICCFEKGRCKNCNGKDKFIFKKIDRNSIQFACHNYCKPNIIEISMKMTKKELYDKIKRHYFTKPPRLKLKKDLLWLKRLK